MGNILGFSASGSVGFKNNNDINNNKCYSIMDFS